MKFLNRQRILRNIPNNNNMNEDKVLQVANFVRETIEKNTDFQCDKSYNILDFPNKGCDYASWLLWNFLREKGIN